MPHKVLLVDDDKDILDLLKYNLEREGYTVMGERDSQQAVATAHSFQPDLIILDIMMPKVNGIEVCSQLRNLEEFKSTYIFFLTAKSEKYLQSEALEQGGDDYIEKITGLRALTHKVSTVLKKNLVIRKCIKHIDIGDLHVDRTKNLVYYRGKEVVLPKHEFELLYFMAQNPRKSIPHDSILHNIWGSEVYLFAKSIDTYINNIKQKIGAPLIAKQGNRYRLEGF
ncbi:response regulator transcription factor [Fulvivirga sp. RKSG066]|uniref:response regulator transcription factor n=1 Tax=Fulvivirga aurantia TaxID=2529383 RepID=UPI0012BCBE08|nr:response regulator transcription factor [Fulvivirga aurantia]MTI19975.1 response regulator transcription factor [Fulvivirga aurantia]